MDGGVVIDNSSPSAPTDAQKVDRLVIDAGVQISLGGQASDIMVGYVIDAMGTKTKVGQRSSSADSAPNPRWLKTPHIDMTIASYGNFMAIAVNAR